MQRFLITTACVCGCACAGARVADRLKRRATALTGMRDGLRMLTNAVTHSNRSLAEITDGIAAQGGGSFWRFFTDRLSAGEDAGAAWQEAVNEAARRGGALSALSAHDRSLLNSFANTLGKTNRASQSESGRMLLESLSFSIHEADATYAQKGRVYRMLGLFLGLGLGILLW